VPQYDARRNDLACHGLQVIGTSEGKLDFAAVHSPVEAYDKSLLIWPRGTGDFLASEPRPLGEFTKLYSLESFLIGDSCCATKKRRTAGAEYIICGVSTDDGLDFCTTHQKFLTTQPVRIIRPVEWEGCRFAVGCMRNGGSQMVSTIGRCAYCPALCRAGHSTNGDLPFDWGH
jgi:hypothetical protein